MEVLFYEVIKGNEAFFGKGCVDFQKADSSIKINPM